MNPILLSDPATPIGLYALIAYAAALVAYVVFAWRESRNRKFQEYPDPVESDGTKREQSVKETVIIVHGTWAAPDADKVRWYQQADGVSTKTFITRLNAALRERGSAAKCWAHCTDGYPIFHWSGENSWIARTRAAAALGDYVVKLRHAGWHCHIIAHSHGGNILVEALPQIMLARKSGAPLGKLVTLGSPFMDVTTPILGQDQRRQGNLVGASFMVFVASVIGYFRAYLTIDIALPTYAWMMSAIVPVLLIVGTVLRWIKLRSDRDKFYVYVTRYWKSIMIEIGVWLLAATLLHYMVFGPFDILKVVTSCSAIVILFVARRRLTSPTLVGIPSNQPEVIGKQVRLLAIGSRMDEAWQLLHHIRNTDNPLAVKENLIAYLLSTVRSTFAQRTALDRIYFGSLGDLGRAAVWGAVLVYVVLIPSTSASIYYGAIERGDPKFVLTGALGLLTIVLIATMFFGYKLFVALLLPLRWWLRLAWSCTSIFPAMVTYGVRKASWTVLLKIAMGLEGYRFMIPRIEQCPSYIGRDIVKYEDMPTGSENVALTSRSAWIASHIKDAADTFSKMSLTAADASSLLRTIEADQTLVHAAYYTDDECIARIADWIAAGDDLCAHVRANVPTPGT
jgi:hypothetical protein